MLHYKTNNENEKQIARRFKIPIETQGSGCSVTNLVITKNKPPPRNITFVSYGASNEYASLGLTR